MPHDLGVGGRSAELRRFPSLTAAQEDGTSRIPIGYHFRTAVTEGIVHGQKIGNRAGDGFLRPVR